MFRKLQRSFDCIDWNKLWTILPEISALKHLVVLIKNLYEKGQSTIRLKNDITSKEFRTGQRVRPGCILLPFLFNVDGEYIMRKASEGEDLKNSFDGGVLMGERKMTNLRYADDTTLIAASLLFILKGACLTYMV